MLSSIHFQNFRALKDVLLHLNPLTVLVGPNASGKSTVLRALVDEPPTADDVWQQRKDIRSDVVFSWPDANGTQGSFTRSVSHKEGIRWKRHPLLAAQAIRLDLNLLRERPVSEAATQLKPTGANLANVIDTLPRATAIELATEFCSLVPVYGDVDTPPAAQGHRTIRFFDRWNPKVTYSAHQVSDGTLFALAILTLKYQQPAPPIITIEEPERGLHPYLIQEVMKVLRSLTEGPNPIQIILATQSAELLEYVKPEEVRFFTKDPADGSVKVSTVDTSRPDWKAAYAEYENSLRDAWLSGTLGGVPGGTPH